ncbi:MAG: VWA domain-containing protein [Pseudomonadota bacterium]
MQIQNIVKEIAFADPEIAKVVNEGLSRKQISISEEIAGIFIDEIIWALSVEYSFGVVVSEGYVKLLGSVESDKIQIYKELVRKSAEDGPTFARIMAEHLVPVLSYADESLLENYLEAIKIMHKKGTYTLTEPLKAVNILLDQKDGDACSVYFEILKTFFLKDLTYNECRNFAHTLPKAVLSFLPSKRLVQIKQLQKILCIDYNLIDSYFDGLEQGLYILSDEALEEFISIGLNKYEIDKFLGAKFIALKSKFGKDVCQNLKTSAVLADVRLQLTMYLKAKTGRGISIRQLSQFPKILRNEIKNEYGDRPFVFSDGKTIYLPDEINICDTFDKNRNLYKCLVRLESGYYEYGSFEFDIEKAMELSFLLKEMYNISEKKNYELTDNTQNYDCHDLDKFFMLFPVKQLASDLFNIFEHGRIRILNLETYPGLVRTSYPLIYNELKILLKNKYPEPFLLLLYIRMALGQIDFDVFEAEDKIKNLISEISDIFKNEVEKNNCIEACAVSVFHTYNLVEGFLKKNKPNKENLNDYKKLKMPFGLSLRQDMYFTSNKKYEEISLAIKSALEKKKIRVFKSEIMKKLIKNKGAVSNDDLKDIITSSKTLSAQNQTGYTQDPADLPFDLISGLNEGEKYQYSFDDYNDSTVFKYREWDANLCDYLHDHVRVHEREVEGFKSAFYSNVLNAYPKTVKRIRREFEYLRPDEIKILKRWIEGDEFDLCALPEYVIDKKAGMIPTDKLYLKRIKHQRDIAVLLLVDLSRSTSTLIAQSSKTVHDIIKEAVVLFCEALTTAQDNFAIAGFSGTGRSGVDYFNIKTFSENMDENIINKINAIFPQRRTRMGAAIRHGVSRLENTASKTRLLVIISDGFPNDTDYKQNYAIEDTRKAVFEAQSKNICVRAITVDAAMDMRLDDLYGQYNHNIISDVRDLPDRLLKIYGTLTKQ